MMSCYVITKCYFQIFLCHIWKVSRNRCRSRHSQMFFKTGVFKNFAVFTGKKPELKCLFNKVAGLNTSIGYFYRCTTELQIQLINIPVNPLLQIDHLFKKYFPRSYKTFLNFFLISKKSKDKNCEPCTSSPLIQF